MKKFKIPKVGLFLLISCFLLIGGCYLTGELDIGHALHAGEIITGGHICITLATIGFPDGSNNTAGVQQEIFFAPLANIAFLPSVTQIDPTGTGAFADLATITGNIIMKPGMTFNSMYVTLNQGEIKSDAQGEIDGMSYKNTLSFLHPGNKSDILGFSAYAKNGSFIFLVPEVGGALRVFGTQAYPAKLKTASITTGKKTADLKAGTFTFESDGPYPSAVFMGSILDSYSGSGFTSLETETYYAGT